MARDIQHSIDDMHTFKLTGCLSKCNKYHYTAIPKGALREKGAPNPEEHDVPNFEVHFEIPKGTNELREQVMWRVIYRARQINVAQEMERN